MFNFTGKSTNRRVAFRIYEQVNLFYHKIDPDQLQEQYTDFSPILDSFTQSQTSAQSSISATTALLPASSSQENDTLNANISASGIAFTCREELEIGDYLMIRILLLSSMTVIMTCCRVVYCKDSNPYETGRYPHLVGAHFVNLNQTETELLHRHISRRKKQQLAVNAFLLGLILSFLAMPDLMFGLVWDFFHKVLEIILHLMHLVFEYTEYNLDHVIEHTFHTDLHTTQVIAFYTLLSLGFVGLYIIWRVVPPALIRFFHYQVAFWTRKKSSFLYYWGHQSLTDKIILISSAITAIAGYGYFAF